MMRNFGTHDGGFGAYFYPSPHYIKVSKENIKAFEKGLEEYDIYEKIPAHWWDYPTVNEWKDNIVPPLPPLVI